MFIGTSDAGHAFLRDYTFLMPILEIFLLKRIPKSPPSNILRSGEHQGKNYRKLIAQPESGMTNEYKMIAQRDCALARFSKRGKASVVQNQKIVS